MHASFIGQILVTYLASYTLAGPVYPYRRASPTFARNDNPRGVIDNIRRGSSPHYYNATGDDTNGNTRRLERRLGDMTAAARPFVLPSPRSDTLHAMTQTITSVSKIDQAIASTIIIQTGSELAETSRLSLSNAQLSSENPNHVLTSILSTVPTAIQPASTQINSQSPRILTTPTPLSRGVENPGLSAISGTSSSSALDPMVAFLNIRSQQSVMKAGGQTTMNVNVASITLALSSTLTKDIPTNTLATVTSTTPHVLPVQTTQTVSIDVADTSDTPLGLSASFPLSNPSVFSTTLTTTSLTQFPISTQAQPSKSVAGFDSQVTVSTEAMSGYVTRLSVLQAHLPTSSPTANILDEFPSTSSGLSAIMYQTPVSNKISTNTILASLVPSYSSLATRSVDILAMATSSQLPAKSLDLQVASSLLGTIALFTATNSAIDSSPSLVIDTLQSYAKSSSTNVDRAKSSNKNFQSLSVTSACSQEDADGTYSACVLGQPAQCVNGSYVTQSCSSGESCFAMPLKQGHVGVEVGCWPPNIAHAILSGTVASNTLVSEIGTIPLSTPVALPSSLTLPDLPGPNARPMTGVEVITAESVVPMMVSSKPSTVVTSRATTTSGFAAAIRSSSKARLISSVSSSDMISDIASPSTALGLNFAPSAFEQIDVTKSLLNNDNDGSSMAVSASTDPVSSYSLPSASQSLRDNGIQLKFVSKAIAGPSIAASATTTIASVIPISSTGRLMLPSPAHLTPLKQVERVPTAVQSASPSLLAPTTTMILAGGTSIGGVGVVPIASSLELPPGYLGFYTVTVTYTTSIYLPSPN